MTTSHQRNHRVTRTGKTPRVGLFVKQVPGTIILFCRGQLTSDEVREHLIPDAIGGRWWVFNVCDNCNHTFGATADSFVNDPYMWALRVQSGMRVNKPLCVEYDDHDFGVTVHEHMLPDGTFRTRRKLHELDDGHVIFTGYSNAEADEIVAKPQAAAAKLGQSLTFSRTSCLPQNGHFLSRRQSVTLSVRAGDGIRTRDILLGRIGMFFRPSKLPF